MNPERWDQIKRVYHSALDLAPDRREGFLKEACAGDESLHKEVASLLAQEGNSQGLFESPAMDAVAMALAQDEAHKPQRNLAGHILQHYQIEEKIGEGGMGVVYRARDTRLDRTVALKVLSAEVAVDQDRMRRFIREAKAASALKHSNVAHIYEIGEEHGVYFIAMEYVPGQMLRDKINGPSADPAEIIQLGLQVADALDAAHAKGITHRDIKPANLMVTPRGQVKVLDFGLAKITAKAPQGADTNLPTKSLTSPGVVMGTVQYMSPEQALGREVDHRSDLFSVGVVMYEMATGRLPFAGANASETIERITHAQPEAIARFNYNLPSELERIVRKCLEKDRERRYQSARELIVDLKNLQRDSDTGLVPTREQKAWLPGRAFHVRRTDLGSAGGGKCGPLPAGGASSGAGDRLSGCPSIRQREC